MSPTPDSTLDDPQQIIADLKRQLAERTVERDEAQQQLIERTAERDDGEAQQAAITEVLGVINSSPGDLAPVFDAILEKAHNLCGSTHGALASFDGEHFRVVATHGLPDSFVELFSEPFRAHPGSLEERLVIGDAFVHVPDVAALKSLPDNPITRAAIDLTAARTVLLLPLRKDGALLGLISAHRKEVWPFSEKEIALLQNFAAQAVIAVENARLITETREALEQQTATAEVLGVINSSPGDLAPVFDAMVEKATRLCEAASGHLYTYDGDLVQIAAAHGDPRLADYLRKLGPYRPPSLISTGRIIAGERIVQIVDVLQEVAYQDSPTVERAKQGVFRTLATVALRKDDTLLGMITVHRAEVRPFTDKQIALLENFAAQAVIAMENARLITETREALEQQTATAEVLQVINSSPGDLAPVFDAILEKAHSLCGAAKGSLVTVDGEHFRTVATRGLSEPYAAILREAQHNPDLAGTPWERRRAARSSGSPPDRMLKGASLVHLLDVRDSEFAIPRAVAELEGVRTMLFVPLRKDSALLGYITAYRQEVRAFTDKQIALLQNFAAQAVIAMENARLLGELQERTHDLEESLEYQTATSDVLKVISRSTFDLQPVLDTLVETASRLCNADGGGIATRQGDVYRYVAHFSANPEWQAMLRDLSFKLGRDTIAGRALLQRGVVHVADIAADPEHAVPQFATVGGRRTVLAVPLLCEGEPTGVLTVARSRVQPFTERQIELVTMFADQAVIAIENARLLSELRQRTEEVGELNRDLEARVAEQVDELGRVGRLKRFLAPQLAELIVSQGDEKILESHRREIVVVFCDLRGYTAFTETAEPEEVLDFLRQYHGALGPLVSQFEGTLDQFSGDGIMVFFNDPVPCPDPAERAVKMAMAMREVAGTLIAAWRRRGRMLGFGAGIAQGYATLGQIGFADRSGYTAIGTVCNLAARLCAAAKDGQILIAQLVAVAVEETTPLEAVGELTLKGLTQPVVAYNVPLAASQPALRVIEGGSPQTV